MQLSNLKLIKDTTTLPFNITYEETKKMYKVYNDGGHYIAVLPQQRQPHCKTSLSEMDILFNDLYDEAVKLQLSDELTKQFIRWGLEEDYADYKDLDDYIEKRLERKNKNFYARKKRFRRKAHLNEWNYFVTFTYDDALLDEDKFRTKLRNCLSHLHDRRGWRYMGVFERVPETGRLHFHGLFYIPKGEMVGNIAEKREFNTHSKQMETIFENDFFRKGYGRNDFEDLQDYYLREEKISNYILKYINKSGEKIVYSRSIPTEIMLSISDQDIITEMQDFCIKFVLFDDIAHFVRTSISNITKKIE